ncbi:MAG: tetratricopeptide repeat protein [Gemmatimonadetes bacterium]|uniref:Tetratricopeptide repeat protein n=1 Tax=Candidatus Kutchimonas denitrificans TaxID=3056748 RepID=A0AAE4Z7S7_9BACT|nr:tetratricopeptide repeat protein [Gemmatimonadota bacterium]NIR74047.1 tetratricopeptide repeat protein [Candidatus Kutchimonas denitrificans]NIS03036.1 tetratricopeptide repeat protein [Gemmatimonadota bacterium]NIT68753.1 tetratricopeptide repeat protein [Gemmatimonadota bacterium]NIU53334.1 tetratricopeptide repeat protein [Gemmatimonadota bacterium]
MRKAGAIFALVLAGLFAVISLVKLRAPDGDGEGAADAVSATERQRVLHFWEIYREATEHRTAGRVREAAEAYARALELNGRHEDALYYLGSMQLELGDFGEAEKNWKRLLEVNPSSGRAHSRLAALYSCPEPTGLFDLDRAAAQYRSALELNQEQTGPRLGLAELALARGDMAAASRYLDHVLGSDASSVEAHFLEGYIAWKRGDMGAARASFAEAVERAQPEKPAGGVAGEGDTRAGSRPLLASVERCRRAWVDRSELRDLDVDASREMVETRYRRLDAQLAEFRPRRP